MRRGDDWPPLEVLFADKVATQKDILEKHLVEEDLAERERRMDSILIELGMVEKRWESESGRRVDRERRCLC